MLAGASLTTDNIESAEFTSGGNTDENNDFGLWGGALPVEWLNINARGIPNGAEVVWSPGSEDNNSHFIIERTIDGMDWENIGRITGAGYATTINNYSVTDENPNKDINYDRVKQVDFDGQFDYSYVVVINNGAANDGLDLKVYPNPANNYVYIRWNKDSRNSEVRVLDINGEVVAQLEPKAGNTTRIDLTNFDTGIYFLKYTTGEQEVVKKLFIKHLNIFIQPSNRYLLYYFRLRRIL